MMKLNVRLKNTLKRLTYSIHTVIQTVTKNLLELSKGEELADLPPTTEAVVENITSNPNLSDKEKIDALVKNLLAAKAEIDEIRAKLLEVESQPIGFSMPADAAPLPPGGDMPPPDGAPPPAGEEAPPPPGDMPPPPDGAPPPPGAPGLPGFGAEVPSL